MFQTTQQFSEFPLDSTLKTKVDEMDRYTRLVHMLVVYFEIARLDGVDKIAVPSEFLGESFSDKISLISDLKKEYCIKYDGNDVPFVHFKLSRKQVKKTLHKIKKEKNKVYYDLYRKE